uniref:Uncharacterized protein n=1 Tax=Stomoxys calcitrans TaxID=35570 RepID=A0A1I8Q601_STOCA
MGCHQCLLISAISVIIFGITDINASRFFSVELSGANVTYFDREVLKCMNLRIYNPKLASMDFTLAKDLSKFNLHFLLNIIRKDERQNNIMNVTMSGCEALAYNKNGNFLKIVLREVHRVSNLPKKCPLLKEIPYAITNFTLKDDDFPITFPIVVWQLTLKFSIADKTVTNIVVDGRVRKM